jgi:hypothetical protein
MHASVLALILISPSAPQADWEKHPENRWVQQSPRPGAPAPKLGWEGSGAYDPFHRLWIHHAGHDGIPQGFVLFTLDLDTGAWAQRFPPNSPPGVCCVDGANVFDPAARRFVRFPGGSLGHGYQWSRGVRLKESPVWLYDVEANRWTNMRPAPYGEPDRKEVIGGLCPGAAYAENLDLAISFGGTGSSGAKNNLHAYDAWTNTLHVMKPAKAPEVRDGMGLAYDSGNDCLVLFGSQYLSDEKTWIYRFKTNAWEAHDLTPRPPGKKGGTYSTIPKMAYDSANGVSLCVVWLGEKEGHETWIFDAAKPAWTKAEPAANAEPSKSRARNLAYSREHNVFILETTAVSGGPQVWTYRHRKAPAPAAPISDLAIVTDGKKATLSWKGKAGVEAEILRSEPAEPWALDFKKVGASKGTSYEDPGIETGKAYVYLVRSGSAGLRARTQPRVPEPPIVSVAAADRVHVRWSPHAAKDVAGYNLYRGVVAVKTVTKGTPAPWKDNDPEYAEPQIVRVTDVARIEKLNDKLLTDPSFEDRVDLSKKGPESGDYKWAVYAYIVRAVNRLGTESGPSPYALTIPSEPLNVLCHEKGTTAELKWEASAEKGIQGYHVYKLEGGVFGLKRVTEKPVAGTSFTHEAGKNTTRYWVVTVDALGQEGQPSSPAWFGQSYKGFFQGDWHQ